jgi:anaerobic selenocysteine-containing dehydrogenase
MAWNSSMNTVETLRMLTDKHESGGEAGEYKIPFIIYSDAYYSETVPYADLVLPDTTYLERHDCISLLDRPISHADGPGDAIRHPVVEPDRNVRPFQTVLIELGARLSLPDFVKEDGTPKYRDYADYIVNHERLPGIGPLAGWRGEDGETFGTGKPNQDQLQRYIDNGGFWHHDLAENQRFYKMGNRSYLEFAVRMGFKERMGPVHFQLYSEPLQKFRLAGRGHGKALPPETERARIETYMDPLPFWYEPFEEAAVDRERYTLHALTQRPMHMYHSWGSQNAWLRQITSQNRLFVHWQTAFGLGLADDDWVWIESVNGRVKCQIKLVDGVNPDTVWTWNAIGKRRGAWGLKDDAAESGRGFLLNHIIGDKQAGAGRYSNSDPVTGQAAWFDLKVRIEKCAPEEAGFTEPQFERFAQPPHFSTAPEKVSFGAEFRARREATE